MTYETVTIGGVTHADTPNSAISLFEPDIAYAYDLLGRLISATDTNTGHATFTYDALGRVTSQASLYGTSTMQYDVAGRRTRLTYPGSGLYVDYDYLVTGEVTRIRENGATSGIGLLATYAYDNLGRRTSLTRGNGTTTTYGYDPVSRLTQIVQNLNGTANDLILDFTRNPAGQIATNTRDNTAYSFVQANTNVTDTINGRNQVTQTGSTAVTHDARGNITDIGYWGSGGANYVYNTLDQLWWAQTASPGVAFSHSPLGLLDAVIADNWATITIFHHDGGNLIAERDYGSGNILRRYVFGPGVDEPLVWYEGSGTGDRRWFHADERGSVIAISDGSGDLVNTINRYDEYGVSQGTLTGRFGYTGQVWIPEAGLYDYRARAYNPALGRFMQTDSVGYGSGMNLYAYVGGDPLNQADPAGTGGDEIVVTGPSSEDSSSSEGPSAELVAFSDTPASWSWADSRDHERAAARIDSLDRLFQPQLQYEGGDFQFASQGTGFSVDLVQQERLGGHTIAFHVNKSHNFLIARLRGNQYKALFFTAGLKRAGSYTSLVSATRLTNAALSAHSATVQRVASGSLREARLDLNFRSLTGYEAYTTGRSAPIIRQTFGVRVYIVHDPQSFAGFRVHTSFPMNRD